MTGKPTLVVNRGLSFASVFWTVEDLLELRPGWTRAQCLDFLARNESHLRDRLVEQGWQVLEDLLAYDEHRVAGSEVAR